ncbi:MBL fold metallo-hydrolase [Tepidibacillus infernus]|uniref:MBL fold metallo-hydrolase n=1 Tax=Tepidibacillus TaxID=1494427 RepID=UPI000853DD4C|nr:MBL fold metallo-hydrolase [Tepidibacillus sp. HK-1]GBF12616.1 putative metallo-hydrolase [Tepidibacillus sp. HK-1]
MQIERFILGDFQMNSYLLIEGKDAILIDVGFDPFSIEKFIKEKELTLKAILLTHAHLDHIGGLEQIRERFKVPVYLHQEEKEWLSSPQLNGSEIFPFFGEVKCKPADVLLCDLDSLEIESFFIEVIHTPGHTPGGISYYLKPFLFSGDTLFKESIGRTDLKGGNYDQLLKSIHEKLFTLPDETVVYPGHGEKTTIRFEKELNPYV